MQRVCKCLCGRNARETEMKQARARRNKWACSQTAVTKQCSESDTGAGCKLPRRRKKAKHLLCAFLVLLQLLVLRARALALLALAFEIAILLGLVVRRHGCLLRHRRV